MNLAEPLNEMPAIKRIEPTLLRRGAVIDVDDLGHEEYISEQLRDVFNEQLFYKGSNIYPAIIVDYVVRNGPDNYELVPFVPTEDNDTLSEAELREMGVVVDTRHVTRVKEYTELFHNDPHRVVIEDRLYDGVYAEAASGAFLARTFESVPGGVPLRPQHSYVSMNAMGMFVMSELVKRYGHLRWMMLDLHHITTRLINSKTLHQCVNPVLLQLREKPAHFQEAVPFVFLDVNRKRFAKWLKRNATRFFQGSAEAQRVADVVDWEAAHYEHEQRLKNLDSETVTRPVIADDEEEDELFALGAQDGHDQIVGEFDEPGGEPEAFLPLPDASNDEQN